MHIVLQFPYDIILFAKPNIKDIVPRKKGIRSQGAQYLLVFGLATERVSFFCIQ
jgi:hypothetical protein